VLAAVTALIASSQGSGAAAPERATRAAWEARKAEGGVAQSAQVTTQSVTAAPVNSAPGGADTPSGDSGALSRDARAAGAEGSGASSGRVSIPDRATAVAMTQGNAKTLSAPEQTAGSSVLPTALYPAPQPDQAVSPGSSALESRTAMRTHEVALVSGGEANCRSARKALVFYQARAEFWRAKMDARVHVDPPGQQAHLRAMACSRVRYLARVMRSKARAARLRYERWHRHEYAWREWLPAVWQRLIQCETGSRHDWNSGAYQGAYGFAASSWDAFRLPGYPSEAYLATPREQWNVALAIWRRYGYGAWGCGGS